MKMFNFIRRSLKLRYMMIFSSMLLIVSAINFYSSYSAKRADSLNFAEDHLTTLSEMLAFSVGAGLSESNFDIVQTAFNWSKEDSRVIYVDIFDETDNSIVKHNPGNISIDMKKLPANSQIVNNDNYLIVRRPIIYKEKKLGNIAMAFSLEQMYGELLNQALTLLLICVVAFIAGMVVVYLVTQVLVKQIRKMNDAAIKVGQGDLSVVIETKSEDELGKLADALKTMVGNLKNASDMLLNEKIKAEDAMKNAEVQKNMFAEQKDYLAAKVDQMLGEMNRFANGDLTVQLKIERDDEIGKLYKGFNMAVMNTGKMISAVSNSIQATASAATEISSSSEEMAAGASHQSQQTNEVTSSVEEMTKAILDSAKNISVASELSKQANLAAKAGSETILNAKKGMSEIASSAKCAAKIISSLSGRTEQIGEITQVIDDIADQTNLLALNAAIEAARAGEQGRGFAVVADEVRKLAERTTKATKEIAQTIKAIQQEAKDADVSMTEAGKSVSAGISLTEEVEKVLREILNGTSRVASVINEVAHASEEQSNTAELISKNIENINNITMQSVSGTEQIARAAEDLGRLTVNLQDQISKFNIGSGDESESLRQSPVLIN